MYVDKEWEYVIGWDGITWLGKAFKNNCQSPLVIEADTPEQALLNIMYVVARDAKDMTGYRARDIG